VDDNVSIGSGNQTADHAETAAVALEHVCGSLPGGGERRPGQEAMARMVADAFAADRHLVVRAGTGTGKSLAYLVPAILSGRTVVIATATKALQDQLADKDLPFLQMHLRPTTPDGAPFTFAVLKGRNNYLCRQRLAEIEATTAQQTLDGMAEHADAEQLARIAAWADHTVSGDRADLDFEPSGATWSAVSVGSDECPGRNRCPMGDHCFAEAARESAAMADVVVTNLYLYGIDVATGGAVLPHHEIVVLDEAHQAEQVLSSTLGFDLHGARFRWLRRICARVLSATTQLDDLDEAGDLLDDALAPRHGQRLVPADDPDIVVALDMAERRLAALAAALGAIPDDAPIETAARTVRARQATTALQDAVQRARTLDADHVAWVGGRADRPILEVEPIEVAGQLVDGLWPDRTVVLTSATVPANLVDRLGLTDTAHTVEDVGSPFDFENQAMLYCAAHLPDPRDDGYRDALHDEIERLILAAGGRTLALFTSRRALDTAVEYLRPRLPYTTLHQDDLPKPALLAAFARDETSCLFGTKGLWHGIDVPGPSCSLVIVDRLPFPRPDDPLLSARRERVGDGAFRHIDLPLAATELAQAVGRLIRSDTDCGVAAVLDKRLASSRSYRWDLIAALPPMERTSDPEAVARYLERLVSC